eukprot:2387709-Pyramimonas_sp.AAC.1
MANILGGHLNLAAALPMPWYSSESWNPCMSTKLAPCTIPSSCVTSSYIVRHSASRRQELPATAASHLDCI